MKRCFKIQKDYFEPFWSTASQFWKQKNFQQNQIK